MIIKFNIQNSVFAYGTISSSLIFVLVVLTYMQYIYMIKIKTPTVKSGTNWRVEVSILTTLPPSSLEITF